MDIEFSSHSGFNNDPFWSLAAQVTTRCHCVERSSVNILSNISFCALQKKGSHIGSEQHKKK